MKFGQLMDIIMDSILGKSLRDLEVWVLNTSIRQPVKDKKTSYDEFVYSLEGGH